MVELLTFLWLFHPAQPALSSLNATAPQATFSLPASPPNSFTVTFSVDVRHFTGEKRILDIPDVLRVDLRQHDPRDRGPQNYPAFPMPDGSVPVLEATVVLHSQEHPDWKNLTVGVPLAMLESPEGEHRVVLNFTGPRWTMFVDGRLVDNEFPFGYPRWSEKSAWSIDPTWVKEAAIYLPDIDPEKKPLKQSAVASIQYWTPPGHNCWVGDVVTAFHQGRYHVFYLYDRRHHRSKFGCGAHYFEHLSTADFKTWTEHEAATPIEEQWECIGTGTPFVFDGKLCLAYGLHTTRVYPQEKTALPAQWEQLKKNGASCALPRATAPGFPAGSTYAVSADGVAFTKSHVMFHPCENPSVYNDPGGKLRMMANYRARGTWEADAIGGPWRCVNPDFPSGGDCTFFFRWGKFDYVIGGFGGLWSKPAGRPDSDYVDLVRKGLDLYDGSSVPSIAGVAGGRYLMAAWLPIRGWGGPLVIRELVQLPDGRLGSHWMPEIVPATAPARAIAPRIADTMAIPVDDRAYLLTFTVRPGPKKGRFAVAMLPQNGDREACEFQVSLDELRAQYGPGSPERFAAREKSLREGGAPHHARNYAIENLLDIDRPFHVRLIVKGDAKLGGTLVDAEIAGRRTMISYRPELSVKKLQFRIEGAELCDVAVAALLGL